MNSMVGEVLEFINQNDVKFVKLSFCDMFGFQKNISIMADELESAFQNGVSFDAHAIRGFRDVMQSDLLLFPDPAALTVLPWRPGPGRVARFFCDIKSPQGEPYSHDGRNILKSVAEKCEKSGYVCKVGAECEFYLFKTDEDGNPTDSTLDMGGYLDIPPLDKGEDIRREICLTLEEMGIKPESSHHEQGPGQNEIDFKFSDALECADSFLTFKSVVKAVASRNGLYASFMPKPVMDSPGNGMHINLSLSQNGLNVFKNADEELSTVAESFIAGILEKTPEISVFLNPITNSYARLGKFEAPKYVSWSHQNRSQLVRIPYASGERFRMELRSPDPSLNPYIAIALIMAAGLEGMEKNLILPPPIDADLFAADNGLTNSLVPLPDSLDKSISLAENSEFVKRVVGGEFLAKYIGAKKAEAALFNAADTKTEFYKEHYFPFI